MKSIIVFPSLILVDFLFLYSYSLFAYTKCMCDRMCVLEVCDDAQQVDATVLVLRAKT